jgi:hypothetical protein
LNPPDRQDVTILREWWELGLLEKEGCFDDDDFDEMRG